MRLEVYETNVSLFGDTGIAGHHSCAAWQCVGVRRADKEWRRLVQSVLEEDHFFFVRFLAALFVLSL